MGDRGNIVIQESKDSRIFFYSHWGGSELPNTLGKALARHERWNDASYLARIIFCTMVSEDVEGETGFGISTEIGDNEYPLLVVDCEKQRVLVEDSDRYRFKGKRREWSFEEFAKAFGAREVDDGWEKLAKAKG